MKKLDSINVLIVEDDFLIGKGIADVLNAGGFHCVVCDSGLDAIDQFGKGEFSLVIVDLALEDHSALGALRCLRMASDEVSLIVLTPIDFRDERIMAIEAGAEDFVVKPFAMREVLARAEAAVVRARNKPKALLSAGVLTLDLTTRRAARDGKQLTLTPTELRILEILLRNLNKVVTRRMLCEFLWNPDWEGITNVIEVHMNRLRRKVEVPGSEPLIHTIRGKGYMLRPQAIPRAEIAGTEANTSS